MTCAVGAKALSATAASILSPQKLCPVRTSQIGAAERWSRVSVNSASATRTRNVALASGSAARSACKFGAGLMSVGIAANSGFLETATRTATRLLPDRRGQEISSGVAAHESDRSQAILDFLVDDLAEPPPKALLVTFLANAC